MKTMNLIIAATFALSTTAVTATEVKIDKTTKVVTPSKNIGVFPTIDWDQLEQRQDSGKEDSVDFQVMMCDDTYLEVVEIEFEGIVGKDVKVETEDCQLAGYSNYGWDTTILHFKGPQSGSSCTITIEKNQNGKKIRMNYELADAC